MASERDARRRAYLDKAAAEIDALVARGVVMGGNAFSTVLLVKGEPSEAEQAGAEPLSGADGKPLPADVFRLAVCTLDPATLVCCDEAAATAVREAYAEELASIESLEEALLVPGAVSRVLGMRVLNLGGFEAALADPHEKQVMWARLKLIPPLGEPF